MGSISFDCIFHLRISRTRPELPNNIVILDIAYLERALFTSGERGPMRDRKTGGARLPESLLSLRGLLHSLGMDPSCVLHNAGNNACLTLVAFQRMIDPKGAVQMMPTGMGTDPGIYKGKAHVSRAATVTARFFRPRGATHPNPSTNGNGKEDLPQMSVRSRSGEGADEMGMKRASMFSALTSPLLVPTDKDKKRMSIGGSMSGSGNGFKTGWFSPSTVVPGQRQHSVIEKQR